MDTKIRDMMREGNSVGQIVDAAIKLGSYNCRQDALDEVIALMIKWMGDHQGYIEQCRSVGMIIDLIEDLKTALASINS